MMYQLLILRHPADGGNRMIGPCTRAECRAEIEAISTDHAWHWVPQADGSQLAVADGDSATVAEAIPLA